MAQARIGDRDGGQDEADRCNHGERLLHRPYYTAAGAKGP
jgi:hypothetical protein